MYITRVDKAITCIDCRQVFTFTASEQEFYADRQFSPPRRCPSCRAVRKASRGEGGGGFVSGGSRGVPRELFAATCARCGRETQVPFRPNGTRPVYCADCFRGQPRRY